MHVKDNSSFKLLVDSEPAIFRKRSGEQVAKRMH